MLNEEISLAKFNTYFVYNQRHPKDFFRGKAARDRLLLPEETVVWKCADFGINESTPPMRSPNGGFSVHVLTRF